MTKEQAVTNLQSLIDSCIARGGIFTGWVQVAGMQESLICLAEPSPPEETKSIERVVHKISEKGITTEKLSKPED